jgi:hypothetical protein
MLLVSLPYLLVAASITTYRYLHLDYDVTAGIQIVTMCLFIIGSVVGWLQGFPRWSYAYFTIIALVFLALLISTDRDMTAAENWYFKLLFLGPVALFYVVLAWLTRKSHSLRRLVGNMRQDWTIFPFCIYSTLLLVVYSFFTDIRSVYGATFLALATLFAVSGACLYLVLPRLSWRLAALVVCLTLTWLAVILCSATFWHGLPDRGTGEILNGWRLAGGYALGWLAMLGLMLLPLAWGRVRGRRSGG